MKQLLHDLYYIFYSFFKSSLEDLLLLLLLVLERGREWGGKEGREGERERETLM